MFKNLLANLDMTRREKLSFYVSSPRIAELHRISLSGTSRIEGDKAGLIERYYVRLDGNFVVISSDLKEQEKPLDVIKLKFDDPAVRDYFYMILRDYEGVRSYKEPRNVYETTVANMLVPRYAASNLMEENPKAIKQTMDTLQKEFEKRKDEFSGSPVSTANLAEIEQKITEIDKAIDKKIFQIYGLSEDEVAFIMRATSSLTRAT